MPADPSFLKGVTCHNRSPWKTPPRLSTSAVKKFKGEDDDAASRIHPFIQSSTHPVHQDDDDDEEYEYEKD
jgi:hypothetical protein